MNTRFTLAYRQVTQHSEMDWKYLPTSRILFFEADVSIVCMVKRWPLVMSQSNIRTPTPVRVQAKRPMGTFRSIKALSMTVGQIY